MTPRWRVWIIVALAAAVGAAALYFPSLRQHGKQAAKITQQTEEQARRELTLPFLGNPGEPRIKAKLFWASHPGDESLIPVTVELQLGIDPVLRAQQVLNTLLAGPVDAELRPLPP